MAYCCVLQSISRPSVFTLLFVRPFPLCVTMKVSEWSGSLIIWVTALALMFLHLLIDQQGHPNHRHESSNVSVKPSTASVSPNNVTTTTLKPAGKSSENKDSSASNNGAATTSKPSATSKVITPVVSTNTTSTTLRSTPKITNVSQNTSQLSVSTVTTAHNSSMTSVPSSVTGMYKMDLFFPILKNSC